jgi:hypothetical protein
LSNENIKISFSQRPNKKIVYFTAPIFLSLLLLILFPSLRRYSPFGVHVDKGNNMVYDNMYSEFIVMFVFIMPIGYYFLKTGFQPKRLIKDIRWILNIPILYIRFFKKEHVEIIYSNVSFKSENKTHAGILQKIRFGLKATAGILLSVLSFIILIDLLSLTYPLFKESTSTQTLMLINISQLVYFVFFIFSLDYGLSLVTKKYCLSSFIAYWFIRLPIKSKEVGRFYGDRVEIALKACFYVLINATLLGAFLTYYEKMMIDLSHGHGQHILYQELLGFFASFSLLPLLVFLLKGKIFDNFIELFRRLARNRGILQEFYAEKTVKINGQQVQTDSSRFFIHILRKKSFISGDTPPIVQDDKFYDKMEGEET